MELFGFGLLANFFFACSVFWLIFVNWVFKRQDYFKKLNVPYAKCIPVLGAFSNTVLKKCAFYDDLLALYNKPEIKGQPFFGMFAFHKPALAIVDPEMIKQIFVKDFNYFSNRYASSDEHDPLGYYNLFSCKTEYWRKMRSNLSPFFSSGRLKAMYYLLDNLGNQLNQHIHKHLGKDNKVEMDMKELAALFNTDVIASCAFGVEANSIEFPDGEFRKAGKSIFEMNWYRGIELPSFFMIPQLMKPFGFKTFSDFSTKFIQREIKYIISERRRIGNKRHDLIDLFVEMKNADDSLTDDMLAAQAAIFYTGGYETSSAVQSFALYEMAKNGKIQNRLRAEIKEMLIRNKGKLTYDVMSNNSEMPYLSMLISESLRMYPILAMLDRECIKEDGYSIEPWGDFTIPKGMPLFIPIFGIHRDPKNFPEPLKFDPERFSPENIGNIRPYTYFPFGVGQRNCVGERLGMMQVKTGLISILKDFRLEETPNTPKSIVLERNAMVIQADRGLFFNLVKDPLY